tara:strand:+ start:10597 stop:11091 length:495 start_codon:yes stop_codon:yes gene_type:complete
MNINNFKIPTDISDWSVSRQAEKPKYQNKKTKKINNYNQKFFDNSQRLEDLYREYMDKYETTILDLMAQMHQATLDQDLELFKSLADKAKEYIRYETNNYFDRLARYIQPRIKSLAIDDPYRNTLGILKRNLHKILWVRKNLHLYFDCVEAPRKRMPSMNYFFG